MDKIKKEQNSLSGRFIVLPPQVIKSLRDFISRGCAALKKEIAIPSSLKNCFYDNF
jgi:predicted methyltransferase